MNRREFLILAAASALTGCTGAGRQTEVSPQPPYMGLATSLTEEHDYDSVIEGRIPEGLKGTLYRNGPGLFERNGVRKAALFDGDGMIQSFAVSPDKVRYKNRFVKTEKFIEEQKAGRFLYPTFSTLSPEGFWANVGGAGRIKSQAGVNVFYKHGRLYAFDEACEVYELNPDTLETLGHGALGLSVDHAYFSAHPKTDPKSGNWAHFGLQYGMDMRLHMHEFNSEGKLLSADSIELNRMIYMHDWAITEHYAVFNLAPLFIDPAWMIAGIRSLSDSLKWRPRAGGKIMIIRRGDMKERFTIDSPPRFMWHTINAFERGDEIVFDAVCYEDPYHFIGADSVAHSVMSGGRGAAFAPGRIIRHAVDIKSKKLKTDYYDGSGYEWPRINESLLTSRHGFAYLCKSRSAEFFWSSIVRVDTETGAMDIFEFNKGVYCTEPVFVADDSGPEAGGWVLSAIYDSAKNVGGLAAFKSDAIKHGPVFVAWLRHHAPFSFHGAFAKG